MEQRLPAGTHFIMGNIAFAEGAVAAGCNFASGYPITPASEIVNRLSVLLPLLGVGFLQSEDEISAVCSAIGASWSGLRKATPLSSDWTCEILPGAFTAPVFGPAACDLPHTPVSPQPSPSTDSGKKTRHTLGGVAVLVGVAVPVGVWPAVGLGVAVRVTVGEELGVGLYVGVGVTVGVALGHASAWRTADNASTAP